MSHTSPHVGMSSKQDFLKFSSNFFLPHGHINTTSGVREHFSQGSLWQILVHWWFPQVKSFLHGFSQEKTVSTVSLHSTIRSVGWLHWHFWSIWTLQGSQAPLWQICLQLCTLQFKSLPHSFSQIGKVPHRPVWLVLPQGHVLFY